MGFNNCIDYEMVWNGKRMESLVKEHGIHQKDIQMPRIINDERSMIVALLSFLESGTGGECTVERMSVLQRLARRFEYRCTLGGTSVRAAITLNNLNCKGTVHLAAQNQVVRDQFPQGWKILCGRQRDELYPHIIFQYRKNDRVCVNDIDICAKRSNRVIFSCDKSCAELVLSQELSSIFKNTSVLMVSGFHTISDRVLADKRLDELCDAMNSLPAAAFVLYEDACCRNEKVGEAILSHLFGKTTVFSLNEDELSRYIGEQVDILNPNAVLNALERLSKITGSGHILLHTRHYAMITGQNAREYRRALESGNVCAGLRFMHGDQWTLEDYRDGFLLPRCPSGCQFEEKIVALGREDTCCCPSLLTDERKGITIGLGDTFIGGFLYRIMPK